jgi:hypothetical protein
MTAWVIKNFKRNIEIVLILPKIKYYITNLLGALTIEMAAFFAVFRLRLG